MVLVLVMVRVQVRGEESSLAQLAHGACLMQVALNLALNAVQASIHLTDANRDVKISSRKLLMSTHDDLEHHSPECVCLL